MNRGIASEYLPTDGSGTLPPNDPEAECGVLGCILTDPKECAGRAQEWLPDPSAFYELRHQEIFKEMIAMEMERVAIDVITLQARLKSRGILEEIGGIGYLASLQDAVPSASNLDYYLEIVREKFVFRRWIALCDDVKDRIQNFKGKEQVDVAELTAQVSTELFKLCETNQRSMEKPMREVIVEVHDQVLSKFRRGVKHQVGPQTGFNYLDNILPGLGKGQLIVEAARPRTGKTAKMMQTAEHIAGVEKVPVAVFSLEMTAVSLGSRAIFQRGGADMTKFLNGFMSDRDVEKLTVAGTQLGKLPLWIDESPRLAIEDLEIRARRMVRQHGVAVIFIDYFQLLYVRNRHRQWSKSDELAECSMRLKGLAKELNLPIYLCAQMNREIERETHRRPRLSDLRDTGQLEQDADVVMFLWKPDIGSDAWKKRILEILPRVPVQEDWRTEKTWKKNLSVVTCTVEKQREGRSGEDATLIFIKPWTRFVDAFAPVGRSHHGEEAAPADEPPMPEPDEPEELEERGARSGGRWPD